MMEIEFKCPHCGVVTFFDGSHLGENWNCRQCDNKVTISLQKKTPGRRERDDFADAEDFKSRHEIAPVPIISDSHIEQPKRSGRYGLMLVIVGLVFGTRVFFASWVRPRPDTNKYLNYMAEEEAARAEFKRQLLPKFEESKPWTLSEEELKELKSNGHLFPAEEAKEYLKKQTTKDLPNSP